MSETARPIWIDNDADWEFMKALVEQIKAVERAKKRVEGRIVAETRFELAQQLVGHISTIRRVSEFFKRFPEDDLPTLADKMGSGPADDADLSYAAGGLNLPEGLILNAPPELRMHIEGIPPEEKRKLRVKKLRYLLRHCGLKSKDFRENGLGKALLLQSSKTAPLLKELFGIQG